MNPLEKYEKYSWVVAVSGGPDSMALLNMCVQAKLDIFVVHINYQKRDTSDCDMKIVQHFCREHRLRLEVVYYHSDGSGNFQALAREFRYCVFKEIAEEKKMEGVLVAHHSDDVIETYLMQKKRESLPSFYGIKEKSYQKGLQVVRPLLNFSKEELMSYCKRYKVPYAIDESNLSDVYERNKVRHTIVEKMTIEEKKDLKDIINQENVELHQRKKEAMHFLSEWNLDQKDLLGKEDLKYILFLWIYRETKERVSGKFLDEMILLLKSDSKQWKKQVGASYLLSLEYGKLYLYKDEVQYEYVVSTLDEMETPYFKLLHKGSTIEGISITSKDFPLTVRSVKHGDEIELRFGTKKLNRWFIDRKIPKVERKLWPVVENREGKVIFVPKIGCDVSHYSVTPNIFMVKC